jgi:Carbohydrate binding domain
MIFKIKQSFSQIMVLLLLLTGIVPCLIAAENTDNLLSNGDFEQIDKNSGKFKIWSDRRRQLTPDVNAHSGSYAVKIAMTEKPKWGAVHRAIISQKINIPSGTYLFSCSYKGQNLTAMKVNLFAQGKDDSKKRVWKALSIRSKNNSNKWKNWSTVLIIPNGKTGVSLSLAMLGPQSRECITWLDNVRLEKKQNKSSNLMFNSSFEICSSPGCPDRWDSSAAKLLSQKHYNSELVTGTALSGKNCLKMSYNGLYDKHIAHFSGLMSGFCPDVEEGQKYTVSLYMKTDNPPTKINLWMNSVNRKTFVVDSKKWKKYSFTSVWRQPYRKTRFAFIRLFFGGSSGHTLNSNVWIDDVMAEAGTIASAYKPSFMDKLWVDSCKKNKQTKKNVLSSKFPHLKSLKCVMNGKIDGKLNESFWNKAKFVNCRTPYRKIPVSSQTSFSVVQGKDAFYVGIKAKHKSGRKRQTAKKNNAFVGDWVEFFLDPNARDNSYYQFAINENGNLFTAKSIFDPLAFEVVGATGYSLDCSWRPKLDFAVKTTADGWNAEIRIPLELFRKELVSKAPFKLNLYRINTYTGEANCWTKPSKNFHSIPDYGYLDNVNIHFTKPAIEVSPIVFTPSGDAKGVVGRFSINEPDVKKIKAEIFMKSGVITELALKRTGRSCQFIIPFPENLVKNKTVRLKIWRADNVKPDIQEFSKVKIVSLLSFGSNSLVFKSEKAFPCLVTVRLPQEDLNDCNINVEVISHDSKKTVLSHKVKITEHKKIYKVPFQDLPAGFYDFKAKLFSKGKQLAVRKAWTYLGKKKKYFVRTNVHNSYIEKHGKPFFMTRIWQGISGSANFNNCQRFKDAGFNTVAISPATYRTSFEKMKHAKLFEQAKKNNFYVVLDFGPLMSLGARKHKYTREKIIEIIKTMVLRYRNHPNLLLYHGMDEWWAGRSKKRPFCSDADLKEIYWMVRKLDPYHAFFFNLGPRPLAWYDLRFTDIFSYDCYVRAVSPVEFNLERYMYYLGPGQKYAADEAKPLINVIQFDNGTEVVQSRTLRFVEQRCLAYITLLYGSKGIQYFTGLSWCESKNRELRKINLEIEKLTPILLSYEKAGKIISNNKKLEAKWFKYKGEYYIIAVNLKNGKISNAILPVQTILPDSYSANSVFGSQNTKITNGTLKLSLEPYGVRVLKIK